MNRKLALALPCLLFAIFCSAVRAQSDVTTSAAEPARTLKVVLYPFIPGYVVSAQRIKEQFEKTHPHVKLQLLDLSSNYYAPDQANYIGDVDADIFELDSVFLRDFVDNRKIVAIPMEALLSSDENLEVATRGAILDGVHYGAPHWIRHNFLFFDKRRAEFSSVNTLSGLRTSVGKGKLLVDLRGQSNLGELYLMAAFDRYHDWNQIYPMRTEYLDELVEDDLRALDQMCDPSSCRNPVLHDYPGTHGAEFSREQGRGLIGYSEALNAVHTEASICADPSSCVSPNDISVVELPLDDLGTHPIARVDSFTLSAKCSGSCAKDAVAFIRMMNDDETYRSLLFPTATFSVIDSPLTTPVPSYLIPAKLSLFSDPWVLAHAPLYKDLRMIVESAEVPTGRHLNDELRAIGKQIDKDLGNP